VNDSVAVDAKRILLRYGAPIAVLDKVTEPHRIEFAREIAKTTLPERQRRLRQLLAEKGYVEQS
jgi:bifunctional DNase/RNase